MRATVGPLPPAVYWRRRAIVLGAVLLGVIVLFVACTGGDDDDKPGAGPASRGASQSASAAAPDEEPSFADVPPGSGPSLPDPDQVSPGTQDGGAGPDGGTGQDGSGQNGDGQNGDGQTGTGDGGDGSGQADGQNANVDAPADGSCGDSEISVTPVPVTTETDRGSSLVIKLRIKNVGSRTCPRDLGAQAQELYIDQGAHKYWSSDTCSNDRSSAVVELAPGAVREYSVTWNGREATKCTGGLADGPVPDAGEYEVRGRLSTKVSAPVVLTLR
ncbi:adhesin [Mangrovihabitans endophyticus]|nr:adhesin [Mangrovihabitans endophyticus]